MRNNNRKSIVNFDWPNPPCVCVCLILSLGSLDMLGALFFRRRIEVGGGGGKNFVLIIILFFLDCLTHCNLFSLCSPGGDSDDQNDTHEPLVYITHS